MKNLDSLIIPISNISCYYTSFAVIILLMRRGEALIASLGSLYKTVNYKRFPPVVATEGRRYEIIVICAKLVLLNIVAFSLSLKQNCGLNQCK
ncbi:hypothetical protein H8E77_27065 [bacterium]|nr:hypothetical protein [bacterium]